PGPIRTRLGMISPATKLRFDASGCEAPHGNTVTKPGPTPLVAVTFNATAVASAGTPPRPVTCSCSTPPPGILPPPASSPSIVGLPARVSSNRAGTNEEYGEPGPK